MDFGYAHYMLIEGWKEKQKPNSPSLPSKEFRKRLKEACGMNRPKIFAFHSKPPTPLHSTAPPDLDSLRRRVRHVSQLQKINDEQKSRIRKTEHALQVAEEWFFHRWEKRRLCRDDDGQCTDIYGRKVLQILDERSWYCHLCQQCVDDVRNGRQDGNKCLRDSYPCRLGSIRLVDNSTKWEMKYLLFDVSLAYALVVFMLYSVVVRTCTIVSFNLRSLWVCCGFYHLIA